MLNFNYGISRDQIVEQGEAMGMKGNCNWEIFSSDKDIYEDKYLWDNTFCRLGYYLLQIYRAYHPKRFEWLVWIRKTN